MVRVKSNKSKQWIERHFRFTRSSEAIVPSLGENSVNYLVRYLVLGRCTLDNRIYSDFSSKYPHSNTIFYVMKQYGTSTNSVNALLNDRYARADGRTFEDGS